MNCVVIVAGGDGVRLGAPGGKQLVEVAGRPVIAHTVAAVAACRSVDAIVLVCHPDRVAAYAEAVADAAGPTGLAAIVPGGSSRRDSVAAGLAALPAACDLVAVHDGARPCVSAEVFDEAFAALRAEPGLDGVVVGHPAYDTIKRVDGTGTITETPDRAELWIAQTPQCFRRRVLEDAMSGVAAPDERATDDAALVERAGGVVRMIAGPRWNLKVTVPEDLAVLGSLLGGRCEEGRE